VENPKIIKNVDIVIIVVVSTNVEIVIQDVRTGVITNVEIVIQDVRTGVSTNVEIVIQDVRTGVSTNVENDIRGGLRKKKSRRKKKYPRGFLLLAHQEVGLLLPPHLLNLRPKLRMISRMMISRMIILHNSLVLYDVIHTKSIT